MKKLIWKIVKEAGNGFDILDRVECRIREAQ